jgi:PHS family inorganic phosphate transporter-like MFS transporter
VASFVAISLVSGYHHQEMENINAIEPMWRLLIGLGCVPGVAAMYFRLTIPETPRFTMDIDRNVQQAARDVQDYIALGTSYADPDAVMLGRSSAPAGSRRDFFKYFSKWRNAKALIGTSWSWLAADVISSHQTPNTGLLSSIRSRSMALVLTRTSSHHSNLQTDPQQAREHISLIA